MLASPLAARALGSVVFSARVWGGEQLTELVVLRGFPGHETDYVERVIDFEEPATLQANKPARATVLRCGRPPDGLRPCRRGEPALLVHGPLCSQRPAQGSPMHRLHDVVYRNRSRACALAARGPALPPRLPPPDRPITLAASECAIAR